MVTAREFDQKAQSDKGPLGAEGVDTNASPSLDWGGDWDTVICEHTVDDYEFVESEKRVGPDNDKLYHYECEHCGSEVVTWECS